MKNYLLKLLTVTLLALMLVLGTTGLSFAEEASAKELLLPLMDLISASALYSYDAPETVPGEEGTLSNNFVQAFLLAGQNEGYEIGITAEHLSDLEAQQSLLSSIFTAKLPELQVLEPLNEELEFIGFYPVMEETLENGDLRFIGEVYMAEKPIRNMNAADLINTQWIDRGLFTFRKDDTALNGYRLVEFALGTDLSYEEEFRKYAEEIAVEYESNLGFMVLYPACIEDEALKEDENGVSGQTQDGTLSFSAERFPNDNHDTLASYIEHQTAAAEGSTYAINDEMQYATLQYKREDGSHVFQVISVTDDYIYTAELNCTEETLKDYSMFFSYLENSFVIDELCQG